MKKLFNYLQDVRTEMGKVTWPSRESLIESTGITLLLATILALFVFFADQTISLVIRFLL